MQLFVKCLYLVVTYLTHVHMCMCMKWYKCSTGRSRESRLCESARSYSRQEALWNGTVHLILAWAMRESPLGAVHKQAFGKRDCKASPEGQRQAEITISQ